MFRIHNKSNLRSYVVADNTEVDRVNEIKFSGITLDDKVTNFR